MPSIITHCFTGACAASIYPKPKKRKRFWLLSLILPILPDADVLAFSFGIPYEDIFGHRGMFHSLFFSLILALIAVFAFFSDKTSTGKRIKLLIYFFIISASHGILDAFTSGGLGIALFAPFDNGRYFAPIRPIQVSPIGIEAFFSKWGIMVLLSELLWIWTPLILITIIIKTYKKS